MFYELVTVLLPVSTGLCLNPCSNGICSMSLSMSVNMRLTVIGLNPCSNGICSMSTQRININ